MFFRIIAGKKRENHHDAKTPQWNRPIKIAFRYFHNPLYYRYKSVPKSVQVPFPSGERVEVKWIYTGAKAKEERNTSSLTCLLELPLSKPTLVECEADIDTESILLNHAACIIMHPLSTYVEHRTVVVGIHDRNTNTCTY